MAAAGRRAWHAEQLAVRATGPLGGPGLSSRAEFTLGSGCVEKTLVERQNPCELTAPLRLQGVHTWCSVSLRNLLEVPRARVRAAATAHLLGPQARTSRRKGPSRTSKLSRPASKKATSHNNEHWSTTLLAQVLQGDASGKNVAATSWVSASPANLCSCGMAEATLCWRHVRSRH